MRMIYSYVNCLQFDLRSGQQQKESTQNIFYGLANRQSGIVYSCVGEKEEGGSEELKSIIADLTITSIKKKNFFQV